MFKRHETLPSGLKVDRDWWATTKIVLVLIGAVVLALSAHVLTPRTQTDSHGTNTGDTVVLVFIL